MINNEQRKKFWRQIALGYLWVIKNKKQLLSGLVALLIVLQLSLSVYSAIQIRTVKDSFSWNMQSINTAINQLRQQVLLLNNKVNQLQNKK